MDQVLCEICGGTAIQSLMAKCATCSCYQHWYCMQVVTFECQDEWYCDECKKMNSGAMEPSQGGQIKSLSPLNGCHLIKDNKILYLDQNHMNPSDQCSYIELKDLFAPTVEQNPACMVEGRMLTKKGAAMPLVRPCCARGTNQGSQIQDEPNEKRTLNISDSAHGCKSKTKRLHHKIDTLVVINSSVEYARRPPSGSCWTGQLHIRYDGEHYCREFKASFPSKVSHKVCDIVKKMHNNLEMEMLPRMNNWPKSFETNGPVYEDIGLFFFPTELNRRENKDPDLLERSCNFVLRAYVDGRKLLIFSSEVLPPDSQWIDGEYYLWGMFVKPERSNNPARVSSLAA